ncbi:hypothetical protein [Paenibacillus durus]|uniref:DUF1963 domain-containing protein n=1 Tax=Paenibacillus durus TaxID=44251 RepID=A0A089HSQ9_PAEDU|nr:hypothetical protein [Paenibacillus durus]AIQ13780.1 hypothetical protein PDUR_19050 [Paenibacillus durus]
MSMTNFKKVFEERTQCMVFQASLPIETCTSWIGGRAPLFFDDKSEIVNKNGNKHYFYLSLVNPFESSRMFSVFIPSDFEEYLENNIYPNCSIQVIEHPTTTESTKDFFNHPGLIKHSITDGELINDKESRDQSFLIKFGGAPRLIQDKEYYFSKIREDSFDFLFQVDEDGYPDALLKGNYNYPFGFGALYIFAQIISDEIQNPVAGFWQFS